MVYNLIEKCRSYSRFDASKSISRETLIDFVKSARVTASGANLQKLRYSVFNKKEDLDRIFDTLKFAGYLTDWKGPEVSERPTGYIVRSSDAELNLLTAIDLGIAAEAIVLTAAEQGIGSCMFRSYGKEIMTKIVNTEGMVPHLVIAFGYPSETVLLEEAKDAEIKYYRDEKDRHVVPKLPLETLLLN